MPQPLSFRIQFKDSLIVRPYPQVTVTILVDGHYTSLSDGIIINGPVAIILKRILLLGHQYNTFLKQSYPQVLVPVFHDSVYLSFRKIQRCGIDTIILYLPGHPVVSLQSLTVGTYQQTVVHQRQTIDGQFLATRIGNRNKAVLLTIITGQAMLLSTDEQIPVLIFTNSRHIVIINHRISEHTDFLRSGQIANQSMPFRTNPDIIIRIFV